LARKDETSVYAAVGDYRFLHMCSRSNRETSRLLFLLRGFQLFDVPR
jgi:hypothetical protein